MLTFVELVALVDEFAYFPGWRLSVEDTVEGPVLVVKATVPDADDPESMIDLRVVSHIPPVVDGSAFEGWLDWRLRRVALHEHGEWLRRNGVPVTAAGHGSEVSRSVGR